MLEGDGEAVQVPLPTALDKEALKRSFDAALARFAPGVLKTVALVKPPAFGPGGQRYGQLEQVLGENVRLKETDLKDGRVPPEADLLLALAPRALDDKQRFAIDQFLMQGGSVVLATSPFDVQVSNTLTAGKQDSGLKDWLAHHGITVEETLVLDPRNAALPVPVERFVGGLTFREYRMLPYPHFPDLRGAGLDADNPITATLGQLTLNWASPVTLDAEKNKGRTVIELLKSSPQSWVSDSLDLVPDYRAHPDTGFAASGERKPRLLALAVEGRFDSFYQGKESPLAKAEAEADKGDASEDAAKNTGKENADKAPRITGVIDRSPEVARLILVASNSFASDAALDLASQGLNTLYTKPLAFLQNAIDWSLEDRDLLALRGRTQLARTLDPLREGEQRLWEYLNYGLAMLGLTAVWGWRRRVAANDRRVHDRILAEV